jgi:lysophospholipase L1-like esterase
VRLGDLGPSWKTLALALASTALSLGAAELVLREVAPAPRAFRVWRPHLEATFHPAEGVMPGVRGTSHFTISALGMRGDDWGEGPGLRILAIGGSTTESLYLDDSEVWTQQLQDALRRAAAAPPVWVANAGKSGLNSRHHVVQTMRLLDQHPEVDVLVVLAGINDLHQRLSLDDAFRTIDREPQSTFAELALRSFAVRPAVATSGGWRPRELAYRLSRLGQQLRATGEPEHLVQDDAGRVYERWRRYRREASRLRERLPDLGPALREFAMNLSTIADVARRHGVEVVFATQPVLWRADLTDEERSLLWFGGVGDFQREPGHEYYSAEALAEGMARYNQTTLAVCAARGLLCVDLAAELPSDTSVFYDDCHFNENGSRRVAAAFARALRPLQAARARAARGPASRRRSS